MKKNNMETITLIVLILVFIAITVLIFLNFKKSSIKKGDIYVLQERLVNKEKQLEELRVEHEKNLAKIEAQNNDILSLTVRLSASEVKAKQVEVLREELENERKKVSVLLDENNKKSNKITELDTSIENERKNFDEKLNLLEDSKGKMTLEFTNLANRIFEENGDKFKTKNKESLDLLLKPLGEKIMEFKTEVKNSNEKSIEARGQLLEKIQQLQNLNNKLSEDAVNLTQALKGGSKTQGNWGEFILESVLETAGLTKGREYDVQKSEKSDEGRNLKPDVIINLPGSKKIIIDSKVSLTSYEKFHSSTETIQREKYLKEHIISIEKHIKELSEKHYEELFKNESLDFVFMFIPIESAYSLALNRSADIFFKSSKDRIVIVTSSTLLASLKTISYLWKQHDQNKNVVEIARQGGELYNKFVGFVEDLENIGNRIGQANTAYDDAMNKLSTGKGNLIRRVENIRELGVPVKKKLPEDLINN